MTIIINKKTFTRQQCLLSLITKTNGKNTTDAFSMGSFNLFLRLLAMKTTHCHSRFNEFSAGIPVISNAEIFSLLLLHVLACSIMHKL